VDYVRTSPTKSKEFVMEYTTWEKIRLIIPRPVWAVLSILMMVSIYIGMPILALYGLYKLFTE